MIMAMLVLASLALTFALILSYASKKYTVEEDPRIKQLLGVLPKINCGACGYASCEAFAKAIIEDKAPINGCVVGKEEVAKKIGRILGKNLEAKEEKKAIVGCSGNLRNRVKHAVYNGIKNCLGASLLPSTSCYYGCLGFGDCVKVCKFGAIEIKNGIAVINPKKCTGCGACVESCPRGIIKLVPKAKVYVLCSSLDQSKDVIKNCKVGCIACKRCEEACKFDAIHVVNNLAIIDYDKCTGCGACIKVCPRNIIKKV